MQPNQKQPEHPCWLQPQTLLGTCTMKVTQGHKRKISAECILRQLLLLLLSIGIGLFVDCSNSHAQSCSDFGGYVQYQTVYADLSKCGFPEYTNLDLPRIHIYHEQHVDGAYGYHHTNDFTQSTQVSGGDDGKDWDSWPGDFSRHDNTTYSFAFAEGVYPAIDPDSGLKVWCHSTNNCTGTYSESVIITDSRPYWEWNGFEGFSYGSYSYSETGSATVINTNWCTDHQGHDVAWGFSGAWSSIDHAIPYTNSPGGVVDDYSNSSSGEIIQCVVAHRELTEIDNPTQAKSDLSTNYTDINGNNSVSDILTYTLSHEYTDQELSNNILSKMSDFPGSWYIPNGSGDDVYHTTAYSMIDGDHVKGQYQPTQEDGTDAEMQKMKYRIVIPNTEAAKRYRVSWNLVTYDFTTGAIEITHRHVSIDGTGGSDPIYTTEEIVNPPHWDDSSNFFGGVVVTWVDSLVVSEMSQSDPGTGPGSPAWSGVAAGCATCGSAREAFQGAFGALTASFGLGRALGYGSAGELEIWASIPDLNLATPNSLIYPDGIPSTEAIRVSGALRQINAPQTLVDIVTLNAFSYELRFYLPSQVGSLSGGVYSVTGSPFVTWTIQNPDASTNTYNRLQITETRGSDTHQYLYTYNPTNSVWTLTRPDNAQEEISTAISADSSWITLGMTNTVRSASGHVDFQEVRIYQRPTVFIAGTTTNLGLVPSNPQTGFLLTADIVNPGLNARVTTYSYYSTNYGASITETVSGPWFHSTIPPARYIKHSDGTWDYFAYNAQNVTDHITPFGDVAPPTSGAPSDSTSRHTKYYNFDGSDFLTYAQDIEEDIKGVEVSHISRSTNSAGVHSLTERDGTRDYDTYTSYSTTGTNVGKIQGIQRPDGTLTLYTYDFAIGGTQTNTVWSDAPNGDKTAVIDGSKSVTIKGPVGQMISNTQTDIRSVITLANDVYGSYDSLGRPQVVTHLDGTSEQTYYNCCGIDYTIDRDGVTTQYYYDDAKRQVATLRNGIMTSNLLDSAGRVLKTVRIGTDSSQIVLGQWQYDLSGKLVRQTNALGGVTSYGETFDGTTGGLIRMTTNADGGTIIESYYLDGQLKSRTGTAVHGVVYTYDVDSDGHRITTETKLTAAGSATSEAVSSYVDWLGKATKTVYSDTAGSSVQYSYNTAGQLAKEIDPDGVTRLYGYNVKGELTTNAIDMEGYGTIDPSGTNRITFTTNDVVSAHGTDVLRSRTYVWMTDNDDTPTLVSMSESSTDGLQSWQTRYRDSSTPVTTHAQTVYSGTNRTVTVTAPDNSYTITRYANGRLVSVTQYDSTPAQIGSTTYGYDAHGRQNTVTDARNGTTVYTYNDADLVTTVTTPSPGTPGGSSQTTTTQYSKSLQATNVIQPDNSAVTNIYLPTGEIALSHGSRTYPVGYSYDYAGRVKTMTNWSDFGSGSGSRVTTWSYDAYRGFLTNKVYADTNGTTYDYTASGRLQTRFWARGTNTSYAYTPAGDLYTVSYNDGSTPTVTYGYDRTGRMNSVVRDGMTTTFAYDLANDVLSESYSGGVLDALSVTNGYDALLRRTGLGALAGPSVLTSAGYTYDNDSRLATVTSGSDSATYTYVANSPLVGQIAFKHGGVTRMTTTKQYDHLNRLTSISSIPTLATFEYSYNNANQRTRANLPDSYWIYQYDSLGQVTSGEKYWNDGTPVAGQQFEYNFDDIGNRNTTKTGGDQTGNNLRLAHYTNNSLNQITSRDVPGYKDIIGLSLITNTVTVNGQSTYRKGEYFRGELVITNTTLPVWTNVSVAAGSQGVSGDILIAKTPETFSYDYDGNLTNDGLWTYTWDAENRLVTMQSISTVPTAAKKKLDFLYDHQGRRIQKLVSTNSGTGYVGQYTNRFVYDGWNLVAELVPNNSIIRSYLWGIDLSGDMQDAGGTGGLLEMSYSNTSTTNCFLALDGNGNVAALVSAANAQIAAIYEYDPFGRTTRATGPLANLNWFRFSTKYEDEESETVYYGYRYYNSTYGRWLNRDPIEERGGENLVNFVANNPISRVDFTGLEWIISRKGEPRADARATDPNDTFDGLAQKLGLDTKDYKKWAQTSDNSPSLCKAYSIPNMICFDIGHIHWYDYLPTAPIGYWRNTAIIANAEFTQQGFYTTWQPNVGDQDVISHLKSPDLYGYIFVGHGDDGAIINTSQETEGVNADRYTHHGLHFIELYCCNSADKGSVPGPYGPNMWGANAATRGWFLGFEGEVTGYNWMFHMVDVPGFNLQP